MSPITSAAVQPIEWKRLALFAALSGLFGLIITAYALLVIFYAVLVTFGGAYPFLWLTAWILGALLLAWAVATVLLLLRSRFGLLLMMSLSILKTAVYTTALLLVLGTVAAGNLNPASLGRGWFILVVVPPAYAAATWVCWTRYRRIRSAQ